MGLASRAGSTGAIPERRRGRSAFLTSSASEAYTHAYSILGDELHAGTLQDRFDCSDRACVAGVPPDLDVRDGIAV